MKRAPVQVHRCGCVDSTQKEARRRLTAGQADVGHVIVAEAQRRGSGRFGRIWRSPPGGLYATFIVASDPLLAMRAGVAMGRMGDRWGVASSLRWPNDLLVGSQKLGGILIEASGTVALVGIGVNLDDVGLDEATNLRALGISAERDELIAELAAVLYGPLPQDVLREEYRRRCGTLRRAVRIAFADGECIEGRAVDLGERGELIVETSSGLRCVHSAECTHLVSERDGGERPPVR